MTSAELIKLAARVEALQGPCRETNWAIMEACGVGPRDYTGSIDAAATLLPDNENLSWQIESGCGSDKGTFVKMWSESSSEEMMPLWITASTPALALCAAALRARAAIADGEPT